MNEFTVTYTTYRCPFCGAALAFIEDGEYVWLGCRRCLRYVKRKKSEIVRRYVNYSVRLFNWRGLMEELYALYR
ncbi:MAG: hypothetical protein QXE80_03730 [Pyrobaculum sp.]